MSLTAKQVKDLNKMNRAAQDANLGTVIASLDGNTGSSVNITGGTITHTSFTGSVVIITGGSIANVSFTGSSFDINGGTIDNVVITNSTFSGSIVASNSPSAGQILSYSDGYEWIDNNTAGAIVLQGDWNALTNTPDLVTGSSLIPAGYAWRVSVAGSTVLGSETTWEVNDLAVKTATSWLEIETATTTSIWGNITGSLPNQTDLQDALNLKENSVNKSSGSTLGTSNTLYPTQNAVKGYVDAHINSNGTSVHSLGNMSLQSASAVSITGGTITPLTTHANLTGTSVHGLGDLSLQSASAVSITGGTIAPLTTHANLTGTSVHGLGDMSLQSASAVNISGGTITPLTTHANLTGTSAHGLGDLSLQSASAVNITGGTITPLTTHANLTGSFAHSLGNISTQSASEVSFTGGSIVGVGWAKKNISVANSPYTLLANDYTLRCNALSASIVVNLVPAIGSGRVYNIKSLYTSTCIVQVVADTTGTPDLIDGQSSQNIPPSSNMQIQDGAVNYWDIL